MGITVYGNAYGYTNTSDIDGQGTAITSDIGDNSVNHDNKSNVLLLTGMGPATFRHNGKIDGISDMVGNIWECIDGLQLRNGVPYILDENNSTYVALSSSDITSSAYISSFGTINYINNSTNDLLNEGLPVDSAGMSVSGTDYLLKNNSGTIVCYRGANCRHGAGAGVWALNLNSGSSTSFWYSGFRLARKLV